MRVMTALMLLLLILSSVSHALGNPSAVNGIVGSAVGVIIFGYVLWTTANCTT